MQLHRHTLVLRQVDVSDMAAVTHMGTDIERIVDSFSYVQELWISVIEIGVAVWLLARQISFASIVPLIICVGKSFSDPLIW